MNIITIPFSTSHSVYRAHHNTPTHYILATNFILNHNVLMYIASEYIYAIVHDLGPGKGMHPTKCHHNRAWGRHSGNDHSQQGHKNYLITFKGTIWVPINM